VRDWSSDVCSSDLIKDYSGVMIKQILQMGKVDNRNPLKIALQHLKSVNGKCILRVNSRDVATNLKIELIKLKKYKKNEILILNSDIHIKKSEDFKQLTSQSKFNDAIKLGTETAGSRSQMRVQMLKNMKLSLLRGIR
jgi:mannose-1-phosphate guanylyltransferase